APREAGAKALAQRPWLGCCFCAPEKHQTATKAFTPAAQERATFLCSCKERWPKENTARTRSVGLCPPVPCAPPMSRGRRTTRCAQTCAPLRPSPCCGARLALRQSKSKARKHKQQKFRTTFQIPVPTHLRRSPHEA